MMLKRGIPLALFVVTGTACATRSDPTQAPMAEPQSSAARASVVQRSPEVVTASGVSASSLVDHLGDSVETAVSVPVRAPNEGVDFQNRWIFDHYGRFRRKSFAMGHAPGASGHERHYDIIELELPNGSRHKVFFDMTDFWASVEPSPK